MTIHDSPPAGGQAPPCMAARMQPGLTLVAGVLGEGPAVRICDAEGRVHHAIPLDFLVPWPDTQHIVPDRERPQSLFGCHNQGLVMDADGSVTTDVSARGLARIDPAGRWSGNSTA